jgi:hypothetical protein
MSNVEKGCEYIWGITCVSHTDDDDHYGTHGNDHPTFVCKRKSSTDHSEISHIATLKGIY